MSPNAVKPGRWIGNATFSFLRRNNLNAPWLKLSVQVRVHANWSRFSTLLLTGSGDKNFHNNNLTVPKRPFFSILKECLKNHYCDSTWSRWSLCIKISTQKPVSTKIKALGLLIFQKGLWVLQTNLNRVWFIWTYHSSRTKWSVLPETEQPDHRL